MTNAQTALLDALTPYTRMIAELDLSDPARAAAALNQATTPQMRKGLEEMLIAGQAQGWLAPRKAHPDGVYFGRLAKPSEATAGLSIDAVDMEGPAAEHTHPLGEVSFCVAKEGNPKFDGHPPGWVVLPPGSHHTPTVEGGRMLIVYFLPDGAVQWGPREGASGA